MLITDPSMIPLSREFYARDTLTVAKSLPGKYLVRQLDGQKRFARIVEVEAYLGSHDLACHAARGRTRRTEVMFGPPGHAYVYLIYGMYHCLNVVTETEGWPAAVLLRALEPLDPPLLRTQGPGLLCRAMEIDLSLNAHDLVNSSELYFAECAEEEPPVLVAKPRVGVDYAGAWKKRLLRFYIRGNAYVSKK